MGEKRVDDLVALDGVANPSDDDLHIQPLFTTLVSGWTSSAVFSSRTAFRSSFPCLLGLLVLCCVVDCLQLLLVQCRVCSC